MPFTKWSSTAKAVTSTFFFQIKFLDCHERQQNKLSKDTYSNDVVQQIMEIRAFKMLRFYKSEKAEKGEKYVCEVHKHCDTVCPFV